MNKRTIYYFFPPSIRFLLRRLFYLPVDLKNWITGKDDKLTPPKGKIFIGSGDFKLQGQRLLNLLINQGELMPHNRVLDVGCGIGRLAVPLTKYLHDEGSYEGFDIVKSGIDWCNSRINKTFPNFKFIHINLKNDLYNLKTSNEAKNFVFPYNECDFDLVFLFSVFSHMIPADVDNYLKQIHRVLKDGAICIATFFILNEESQVLMKENDGLQFKHDMETYALLDKNVKEANVAYKEKFLFQMIENNNLKIERVNYGYWSGRSKDDCVDFQDTLVLSK